MPKQSKSPSPNIPPALRRGLNRRMLAWFRKHREDLPWRRTADPYAIWVSEIMLQQTQVATVGPYYERFLALFPTVATLARTPEQAVLKTWQGLGYYRRARNLHAAACVIMADHGGRVPDDPAAFMSLPGVGRYTCGAVLSIAFGRPLAALDGNTIRVISRWLAYRGKVTDARAVRSLWAAAEALVPEGNNRRACHGRLARPCFVSEGTGPSGKFLSSNPGDWNQSIMELGRIVCLPRGPRCEACPVGSLCLARAQGLEGRIPAKSKRKPVPHIHVGAGIVWRRGRILLCQRRADAMLGGLWEFPGGKIEPGESAQQCIRRELIEECDLPVTVGEHLIDVTHAYTHLRVTLHCYHCRSPKGRVRLLGCDDARWVRPDEIAAFPLPKADVRILEAITNFALSRRNREA